MSTFVWAAAIAGTWATGANWQVAGVPQVSPPTAADVAQFGTGTGATNSNCTTAAGDVCQELKVDNAYTGNLTIANNTNGLSIGNASGGAMTLGTGMTLTAAGTTARIQFVSTSTNSGAGWAITTAGIVVSPRFIFSGAGGRWTLQDTLTISAATALVVSAGTLDCNNQNVNLTNVAGTAQLTAGTLIFGTGTWTYSNTSTSTIFTYVAGTITGGSETHSLIGTGNNTRTFAAGGQGYGNLRHDAASGTGALIVTGSANTFRSLNCVSGRTLRLTSATTTTVTGANGLGGIQGTLNAVTAASAATISLTSLFVSVMRAVTVKDITVTPAGHAYALDASVSTSGNAGITFNQPFGWGVAA